MKGAQQRSANAAALPRRLWTDADNDALVNDHYPWYGACRLDAFCSEQERMKAGTTRCVSLCRFKDTYDSLPQPVMKADAVRPLYMHRYGGAARLKPPVESPMLLSTSRCGDCTVYHAVIWLAWNACGVRQPGTSLLHAQAPRVPAQQQPAAAHVCLRCRSVARPIQARSAVLRC